MPSNNLQKLKDFLSALGAGDEAGMGALMHPEFYVEQAASLPYGGVHRGLAGWLALQRTRIATWKDEVAELVSLIGDPEGDEFGMMARLRGRTPKAGKQFDMQVFELVRFQDGKIIEIRPFYWDTHALVMLDKD